VNKITRSYEIVDCDWLGDFRLVLLDPDLAQDSRLGLLELLALNFPIQSGVWVTTSGTTRRADTSFKCIALSRDALSSSASAVNRHLQANSSDIWCTVLPDFHVGGLGIHMRAALSGSKVVRGPGNNCSWNPERFVELLADQNVTLSSLVPTQVSDLIVRGLRAPPALRAVVVGGASLSSNQYLSARALGWPLLPSYGLTECSSQVATAPLSTLATREYPELQVLDHIRIETQGDLLRIASSALLSAVGEVLMRTEPSITISDPLQEGWFLTADRVEHRGASLVYLGRVGDLVKVGGEGVSLTAVGQVLSDALLELSLAGATELDATVRALVDDRLGMKLVLQVTNRAFGEQLLHYVNSRVTPAARLRELQVVGEIERTALGKAITPG